MSLLWTKTNYFIFWNIGVIGQNVSPMVGTPAPGASPFGQQVSHSCIIYKAQNQHLSNIPVQTWRESHRLSQGEQKWNVLMCLEPVNISHSEGVSVFDGWIAVTLVQWGNFSINNAVFCLSFLLNWVISAHCETGDNLGSACFMTQRGCCPFYQLLMSR